MSSKAEQLNKRVLANMARVAGLTTLLFSGHETLKPKNIFTHEGVGADLFRVIVVFLHATFEDMLRAHISNPRTTITFSGPSDIEKALARSNIKSAPFKHLYKPLGQLAKRRNRIVHHADLSASGELEPWGPADHWQVVMWNLAVLAFYHQMCLSTNYLVPLAKRRIRGLQEAMNKHVQFGNQLVNFPNVDKDKRLDALTEITATLQDTIDCLKIDTDAVVAELMAEMPDDNNKV